MNPLFRRSNCEATALIGRVLPAHEGTPRGTLVVQDTQGRRHTLPLPQAGLTAHAGQELHIILVQSGAQHPAVPVAVLNRSTGELAWLGLHLTRLFGVVRPLGVGLLTALVLGFMLGAVGLELLSRLPVIGPLLGSLVALAAPPLLPLALWWVDRQRTQGMERFQRSVLKQHPGLAPSATSATPAPDANTPFDPEVQIA